MRTSAGFVERLRVAAAAFDDRAATVDMTLGGIGVRARVAGESLAEALVPSLLPSAAAIEPEIELRAVDGAATAAVVPALPWQPADYLQRDEVRGWTEPPLLAAFTIVHAAVAVADTDAAIGVQWFRDAADLAPWEGGAPLRSLLHWNLARRGLHMLHAAAVDTGAGGVLVAGPGGSGKSTSALAALGQGMRFVGDDYVLVRAGTVPTAHPLYAIVKADERSLTLLPQFADRAQGAAVDWRGKLRLPIADLVCDRIELAAIVLPRVADATGEPRRVGRRAALRTLVPSMLFQLPGDARTTLAALGALIGRLPVFALDVGPDVQRIPERLQRAAAEAVTI